MSIPEVRESARRPPRRFAERALFVGSLLCSALAVTGWTINAARANWVPRDFGRFDPSGIERVHIGTLVAGVEALSGRAVILLGLLLLVALHVGRVVAELFRFARSGDRRYVAVSLYLLAGLIVGLLI